MAACELRRISPLGLPIRAITPSQASMHCVQAMHSICSPSRISMPVGQVSVHRPQSMQSPMPTRRGAGLAVAQLAARLAAPRIVADDQRVAVEHHRLEPPVGTGHDAGLLAEVGEIEHHQPGHGQHHQERYRMLQRRAADPLGQGLDADEVGQESVGQVERRSQIEGILGHRPRRRALPARADAGPRADRRTAARSAGRRIPCRPSVGTSSRTTRARPGPSPGRFPRSASAAPGPAAACRSGGR